MHAGASGHRCAWRLGAGKRNGDGHRRAVLSVAYSPDGTVLASGGFNDTVQLWDVATGDAVATLTGHRRAVLSVAYSPDGTVLAAGNLDGTVQLWDVATGTEVATLRGHNQSGGSVAFSPEGTLLAAVRNTYQSVLVEETESESESDSRVSPRYTQVLVASTVQLWAMEDAPLATGDNAPA